MDEFYVRSRNLYGPEHEKLKNATVLLAGVGGVGSFALEGLARNGIGRIVLVDFDTVEPSNLNRQLVARIETIGRKKVDIAKEMVAQVNPDCEVVTFDAFYDASMDDKLKELKPDYILDCIDSIGSKKDLIRFALDEQIPILSSMGMARKTDPSKLSVMELEKTSYDPIAKDLRHWKRKNRIRDKIMVVSSTEAPKEFVPGQQLPSSIFVPGSAGLLMASRCISDLLSRETEEINGL